MKQKLIDLLFCYSGYYCLYQTWDLDWKKLCFDVICFGSHAPDETHKVETLRFVVHYFVLLFAGILHWLC